ncbi:MAG: hypothetical protein AB7F86_19590 [Bdellovibrionales bacterium]
MPHFFSLAVNVFAWALAHPAASAEFCQDWAKPVQVGQLARKDVPEASGLTWLKDRPDELIWVNDSGSLPRLWITDLKGKTKRIVKLSVKEWRDPEALTTLPCAKKLCLVVGDTGDNKLHRKHLTLYFFTANDLKGDKASPLRTIRFRLPNGAVDIEAMVGLPNGDLLFISKELGLLSGRPARLFRLPRSHWEADHPAKEILVAQDAGELPLHKWLGEKGLLGQVVTDAAYDSKRQVVGLLTYSGAIEISLAKLEEVNSAAKWVAGRDYQLLSIPSLHQQETLVYFNDSLGDHLLWSTEFHPPNAPIFSMTCGSSQP